MFRKTFESLVCSLALAVLGAALSPASASAQSSCIAIFQSPLPTTPDPGFRALGLGHEFTNEKVLRQLAQMKYDIMTGLNGDKEGRIDILRPNYHEAYVAAAKAGLDMRKVDEYFTEIVERERQSAASEETRTQAARDAIRRFRPWTETVIVNRGAELKPQKIAFNPSQAILAVALSEKQISFIDALNGTLYSRTVETASETIESIVFSFDGHQIAAVVSDGTLPLWNTASGTLTATLDPNQFPEFFGRSAVPRKIVKAAFSPKAESLLTLLSDNQLVVWNTKASRPTALIALHHTDTITSAVFSSDESQVVTASIGGIRVWDARTGRMLRLLELSPAKNIHEVAFSPRDSSVVGYSKSSHIAYLWGAQTGKRVQTFNEHEGALTGIAFTRDGSKVITLSKDQTAWIWMAESGAPVTRLKGHNAALLNQLSLSADEKRIVTLSADQTARLFNVGSRRVIGTFNHDQDGIVAAYVTPDGNQVVTVSARSEIKIWSP